MAAAASSSSLYPQQGSQGDGADPGGVTNERQAQLMTLTDQYEVGVGDQ